MDARFPRNELIGRIEGIASRRKAITLRNWDAERFIENYIPRLPTKTLVYCDPPYYEKSGRLYLDRFPILGIQCVLVAVCLPPLQRDDDCLRDCMAA